MLCLIWSLQSPMLSSSQWVSFPYDLSMTVGRGCGNLCDSTHAEEIWKPPKLKKIPKVGGPGGPKTGNPGNREIREIGKTAHFGPPKSAKPYGKTPKTGKNGGGGPNCEKNAKLCKFAKTGQNQGYPPKRGKTAIFDPPRPRESLRYGREIGCLWEGGAFNSGKSGVFGGFGHLVSGKMGSILGVGQRVWGIGGK